MEKYLTPEGLEKLKKELEYLRTIKRKEIAKLLAEASAFGDLTENAAYQEAKEAQAFLEGRILELENLFRNAQVVKNDKKTDWVQIGSTVFVNYSNKVDKFRIVGPEEVNIFEGKISAESPVGKILLGKPKGAVVEIDTPQGRIKYKIVKIE